MYLLCVPHHIVLVLQEDAELLEEGDDEHQELLVIPIQSLDQQLDDVLVPHLQLCARVLRQVEEQVESHWNNTTVIIITLQNSL